MNGEARNTNNILVAGTRGKNLWLDADVDGKKIFSLF